MSERESEVESTGGLVGGLITWGLVAAVLVVITSSGIEWGPWALGGWGGVLVFDFVQAQLRKKEMYIRILSDLWTLPF